MSTTTNTLPEAAELIVAEEPGAGSVYTETVVWSPAGPFVQDAPYQLAIVALDAGGRLTARITGEKVAIGDRVEFAAYRGGIPFFRKEQ
jgi:uncharacterized OB-fold protein